MNLPAIRTWRIWPGRSGLWRISSAKSSNPPSHNAMAIFAKQQLFSVSPPRRFTGKRRSGTSPDRPPPAQPGATRRDNTCLRIKLGYDTECILQTKPDKRKPGLSCTLGAQTLSSTPEVKKYNFFNDLKCTFFCLNRPQGELARFLLYLSYTECRAHLRTRTKGRERWQRKNKPEKRYF